MKYVYLLESISYPTKKYIGITSDLNERFKEHNAGRSPHTAKFRPWKVVVAIRFEGACKAEAFEKYLKSGSGHAFAKKHFLQKFELPEFTLVGRNGLCLLLKSPI